MVTLLFLYISFMIQWIQSDQSCHEREMCTGQRLNDTGRTLVGGYKGAYGYNISGYFTYTSFAGGRIDCSGSYSCSHMAFIKAQTSVYCRGFSSCSDTIIQSISSFIYCYGTISCISSNITTKDLMCVGYMSCADSYIYGIENIYSGGSLSLHGASIDSYSSASSTVNIWLQGYSAGYGGSLLCRAGDTCIIHCQSFDSCNMFYIHCMGNCIVSLYSSHFNAPTTDITVFNNANRDINIHQLFETETMSPYMDGSCIWPWVFDTANERLNGPDIVVTYDIASAICCRAEWSCYDVNRIGYETQTKSNLVCSGSDGCRGSNMSDINTIFCDGIAGCAVASITYTENVYCSGRSACEQTTITGARHVVCRGRSSCYLATFISNGTDLDLYLNGYYSGQMMTVYCDETDTCNIYCLGANACDGKALNCYYNCIIHQPMNNAQCNHPTSDWTLATPNNLSYCATGDYTFQYKYESSVHTYYLSPETSILWSWTQFDAFVGNYQYTTNGGINMTSFTCIGGEVGHWGVGCSNGGGYHSKVIAIYDMDELNAQSTVCAIPGINGCNTATIYYRTCSGLCVPTADPTTANPTTANPTTADPTTTDPTTADPTTADPTTADPTTANPTTTDPTNVDPTTVEPTTANPTTVNPTTANPTTVNPTTANPTTANPTTADPTTADPATANPTTADPTTANPTTADPTTADPATANPTTALQNPSQYTTEEVTTYFSNNSGQSAVFYRYLLVLFMFVYALGP